MKLLKGCKIANKWKIKGFEYFRHISLKIQVELNEEAFVGYNLKVPERVFEIEKNRAVEMYYGMNVIRRLEMTCDRLYKEKKIRGFCHLSTGQEAVAVGIEEAADKKDLVINSYRCHGYMYMRGASVRSIIGELLGKVSGVSKGKGGSMHMFTDNFFGGNGIVGAQVPIGAGLAFSHKYREDGHVSFTIYGDGAANQGQVFEAYNMSKLWNLPCIFVCENNLYGMGTSGERSSALTEYYKRSGFIQGLRVDGMNVMAVYLASKFAREWCVLGKGPIVLEFKTYRYGGHSMSDPGTSYRSRDEVQQFRKLKDPILQLSNWLVTNNVLSESDIKSLDKKAKKIVDDETNLALSDSVPDPSYDNLFSDVYVKGSEINFLRGRTPEESYHF